MSMYWLPERQVSYEVPERVEMWNLSEQALVAQEANLCAERYLLG